MLSKAYFAAYLLLTLQSYFLILHFFFFYITQLAITLTEVFFFLPILIKWVRSSERVLKFMSCCVNFIIFIKVDMRKSWNDNETFIWLLKVARPLIRPRLSLFFSLPTPKTITFTQAITSQSLTHYLSFLYSFLN